MEAGQPGVVGPWTLHEHLGSGGMGSVWKGTDGAGRAAAVKLIRSDLRHDPEARRRFQREFDVARRVTSRRVAIPLDADLDTDPAYIAWEHIDAQTLQVQVERLGRLPADQVMRLARDLAEALRDLEAAGITHRDVKPSNILLAETGAVLVDLGVALVEDQTGLTTGGQVIGTPGWLTPEQLEGQRPTSASDVFNWAGAVVFAATGRGAFGTDTLPKLMYRVAHEAPDLADVPAAIRAALERALAKDPESRPSARQLASEFNALLEGDGPAPEPTGTVADGTVPLPPPAGSTGRLGTVAVPPGDTPTSVSHGGATTERRGRRWLLPVALVAAAASIAAAAIAMRSPELTPTAAEATAPTTAPTPDLDEEPTTEPSSGPSPSEVAADRTDAASYYTSDGSPPALAPSCSGVVGLCLGNPIERAVERLGTEDYRFDLDDEVSHTWDLDAITVSATADSVGSITELSVGTRDGARATTPLPDVIVGETSLRGFVDAVDGGVFADVLSGEGFSIISLGIAAGGEGSEAWQASLSVEWSEAASDAVFEAGHDVDLLLAAVGDRIIDGFQVGYDFPESEYAQPSAGGGSADMGDYGDPPQWVHDTLADARGGYQVADGSLWDPTATINVVTGSMLGGATGRGMYAFFFVADRGYIGTDALEASESLGVTWRDESTIAIEYVLYRDGDPGCCPTGGSAVVRFHWNGDRLVALDEIPPRSGPVSR